MPLTDVAIRNTKPTDRPQKLWDGGGLHVVVNPNGSRLWRLKYRIAGREKLLSIGPYPSVSLKEAREAREQAKAILAAGGDPSAQKRQLRQQLAEKGPVTTFQQVAAEHLDKIRREGRAPATLVKAEWLIGMANECLGSRPIRDITARDVLDLLRRLQANGTYETARRLRSTISQVFRHAVATGDADTDPTFALRGALVQPRTKSRAAITDLDGLRTLYAGIDAYRGQPTTRIALKLLALLVPRPGELRQARWEEFDLARRVWTVPAERMKMRRPHRVPLPAAAVSILEELHLITGWGDLAFPSLRSAHRPISENTLNVALRGMGYGKDEMTAHGFRASFSTIANEASLWHPDAIERALAHVDTNAVRRVYARGDYWDERVRMMDWWAKQLTSVGA